MTEMEFTLWFMLKVFSFHENNILGIVTEKKSTKEFKNR